MSNPNLGERPDNAEVRTVTPLSITQRDRVRSALDRIIPPTVLGVLTVTTLIGAIWVSSLASSGAHLAKRTISNLPWCNTGTNFSEGDPKPIGQMQIVMPLDYIRPHGVDIETVNVVQLHTEEGTVCQALEYPSTPTSSRSDLEIQYVTSREGTVERSGVTYSQAVSNVIPIVGEVEYFYQDSFPNPSIVRPEDPYYQVEGYVYAMGGEDPNKEGNVLVEIANSSDLLSENTNLIWVSIPRYLVDGPYAKLSGASNWSEGQRVVFNKLTENRPDGVDPVYVSTGGVMDVPNNIRPQQKPLLTPQKMADLSAGFRRLGIGV